MTRRFATILSFVMLSVLGVTAPAEATHDRHDVVQTPRNLALGKIPLTATQVLAFTVTNRGSEPLVNNGFVLTANGPEGFMWTGPGPTGPLLDLGTCVNGGVLAPGESCSYTYLATTNVSGRVSGQSCYLLVGHENLSENACSKYSVVMGKR